MGAAELIPWAGLGCGALGLVFGALAWSRTRRIEGRWSALAADLDQLKTELATVSSRRAVRPEDLDALRRAWTEDIEREQKARQQALSKQAVELRALGNDFEQLAASVVATAPDEACDWSALQVDCAQRWTQGVERLLADAPSDVGAFATELANQARVCVTECLAAGMPSTEALAELENLLQSAAGRWQGRFPDLAWRLAYAGTPYDADWMRPADGHRVSQQTITGSQSPAFHRLVEDSAPIVLVRAEVTFP